jgi:hypothetical protein
MFFSEVDQVIIGPRDVIVCVEGGKKSRNETLPPSWPFIKEKESLLIPKNNERLGITR